MMGMVQEPAAKVGKVAACDALDVPRASLYRWGAPKADPAPQPRPTPARAMSAEEKQVVLDTLHSDRFVDRAPQEVYATLLDEGVYLCSTRTMYRILDEAEEVKERRNQRRHPEHKKPELVAKGPNQVWSWDITKLKGPLKGIWYHLYVILDIFSRYAVGWVVAHVESGKIAERLILASCGKQGIRPGDLTVHSDRGSSMGSKPVALLLADLGLTKSQSRPRVSNDNPYSESQFKTLKYCPEFPDRFGSIEDSRIFCRAFFAWYNMEHRHSGIGLMTPHAVHYGLAARMTQARQLTLFGAYAKHPERFVKGRPVPPRLPEAAWINRPRIMGESEEAYNKLNEELSQNP